MSKAIAGAALIAADLALGVAFFINPALLGVLVAALPGGIATLNGIILGLFAGGVSMEAGALAEALTTQRGQNISTRIAAGLRQIVYGQQRIGGNIVYESTTGSPGNSGNYVFNFVVVAATHSIDSFVNLYLDGRQVFWSQTPDSHGWHANIGCGHVAVPPTCTVTLGEGGSITGITATGGSGFNQVKPCDGFRVKITDPTGTGASAWAYNDGAGGYGTDFVVGDWTVTIETPGSGYTDPTIDIQGAYTFGGIFAADQQIPYEYGFGLGYSIGPGGPHYNFAGKGWCEVRFGDQVDGDYMQSLNAYDGNWGPSAPGIATGTPIIVDEIGQIVEVDLRNRGNYGSTPGVSFSGGVGGGALAHCVMDGNQIGSVVMDDGGSGYSAEDPPTVNFDGGDPVDAEQSPWLGDCAYLYINLGYDTTDYPSLPEMRFTINGKDDIYDPRTGTRGFSTNWALQVADVITDPVFGLGDNSVNQAQLIAAANICDEEVATSQGGEAAFSQHIHYDTSTSPGDVLSMMMPTAAGRLSRIGGEWYIWPSYWQGPSFTLDESSLLGDVSWQPYRSFKDLVNCVNGTYIAPNYPYAVTGNLYDANGFWYGITNNLWPFAWQPSSFPQYAVDPLHGYATPVYLDEDGGVVLPKELTFRGIISVVQAQRVAKITLMRNRQQGSGLFDMNLGAWAMQPLDVMQMKFPAMGWTNKLLEVEKIQFKAEPTQDENGKDGAIALSCSVSVIETDPSVYEWDPEEELSPYDISANGSDNTTPASPTGVTAVSNLTTALLQPNGSVIPRILLTWTEPNDVYVTNGGSIEIQMSSYSSPPASPPSVWQDVQVVRGQTTAVYLTNVVSGNSYDIRLRSLRGGGQAGPWVEVDNVVVGFALVVTTLTPVAPSGTLTSYASGSTATIAIANFTATVGTATAACIPSPTTITPLVEGQLFYVYYVDTNFAGGTITPVATQNTADFLGIPGYYLIGEIVTAGTTALFRPTTYVDLGSTATSNPTGAYSSNPFVSAAEVNGVPSQGHCQWLGFAPYTAPSAMTLNVTLNSVTLGVGSTTAVNIIIAGTPTLLVTNPTPMLYTMTIPMGTVLSAVVVDGTALGGTGSLISADLLVSNIFIQ